MQGRIYVTGLRELQRSLKQYAPEVQKSFRKRLGAIATTVAADARGRARWSKRIPKAIVPVVTMKTIGIRVRVKVAPHGPLYERGDAAGGEWRHPLFGDREQWYPQRTRPYLQPAVDARRAYVLQEAEEAVLEAKREVNL